MFVCPAAECTVCSWLSRRQVHLLSSQRKLLPPTSSGGCYHSTWVHRTESKLSHDPQDTQTLFLQWEKPPSCLGSFWLQRSQPFHFQTLLWGRTLSLQYLKWLSWVKLSSQKTSQVSALPFSLPASLEVFLKFLSSFYCLMSISLISTPGLNLTGIFGGCPSNSQRLLLLGRK